MREFHPVVYSSRGDIPSVVAIRRRTIRRRAAVVVFVVVVVVVVAVVDDVDVAVIGIWRTRWKSTYMSLLVAVAACLFCLCLARCCCGPRHCG